MAPFETDVFGAQKDSEPSEKVDASLFARTVHARSEREMARVRSAEEPQLLSDDVSGRPDGV
jgi:hypothetical protein